MNENIFSGGLSRVMNSKRYLIWFFLLNVALAWLGAAAFKNNAHSMLDHSLNASKLVNGFDAAVYAEMVSRPEFGPAMASMGPALGFAMLFFLFTALFLPGVIQGYASTYRLPREDFFRACGRNLWRFIRLTIVAGIVMGIVAGALFGIQGALGKKAAESTNELLSPEVQFAGLALIFLVMTLLRIWFDLAETDVVLSDQRAVRRSIGKGFRHTWRHLGSLLFSYVAASLVGILILAVGIGLWIKMVPAPSVLGAVIVSQLTLLLLLIPRFWQRGIAVSYYLKHMVEPIAVTSFAPTSFAPVVAEATVVAVVEEPVIAAALPNFSPEPETQAS